MNILVPFHVGSGNRGCEGIIRGTANILKMSNKDIFLLDRNQEEYDLDMTLGLDEIGTLYVKTGISFFAKSMHKIGIETGSYYIDPYKEFLKSVAGDAICLFSGGDLFCYERTIKENCYLQEYLRENTEIKTVLWGASIENRFIDEKVEKQLKSFDKIVCRETKTLEVLNNHGIVDNVLCAPDPAFTLEPVKTELPKCFFTSNVIGINISNMVNADGFSMNTPFIRSVLKLINYIIDETNYKILLIPHVTWGRQDDRRICCELDKVVSNKERISVLNIDSLGYLQIRYIISKCTLFIGGRTHSVISAYSTEVPTIALGYSIKAIGIADDLGLDNNLVFDSKNINSEDELLNRFNLLMEKQDEVRKHLRYVLPEYKKRAYNAAKVLETYLH